MLRSFTILPKKIFKTLFAPFSVFTQTYHFPGTEFFE